MLEKLLRRHSRSLSIILSGKKSGFAGATSFFRGLCEQVKKGDTIFALSSGYGKCGVAVIRVSGAEASKALKKMTKSFKLEPRKAVLRKICDPETSEFLDKGLCLWFPGPHSFTGEDSVEFHVHGGPAVVSSILSALSKLQFRVAPPGEFTRRAFLNGKLDLTEAEGIGDLIEAETEQQRRQASSQATGSLRILYDSWRQTLLTSLAGLEADVDFSEENSLETSSSISGVLRKLASDIESHLCDGRKGEILRSGIKVAILGEPNVGKSSLLNLLSRRDAAIVNSMPGTTRDILELSTNVAGYPMILCDTAGIRENPDNEVEVEGIRRAKERAEFADLVLCVVGADMDPGNDFQEFLKGYLEKFKARKLLLVINKVDLLDPEKRMNIQGAVNTSCKSMEGIEELTRTLGKCFEEICGDPSTENPVISHARYRNHLSRTLRFIRDYLEKTEKHNYDMAICLQDIRNAARELGKITGHVSNEEILDVIFKNFCVGK